MKVMSSSKQKFYEVTHSSCTCPDYIYRQAKSGGKCKHMIKIFYPAILGNGMTTSDMQLKDEMKQFFRNGVSLEDGYEKFGEEQINKWINVGEICKSKHEGKTRFYLLE
jgi:hypothetical protein